MKKFLNEREVSEITGRALPTLQKDRFHGRGIPYYKVGRQVRYSLLDVDTFMEGCKVVVEPLLITEKANEN